MTKAGFWLNMVIATVGIAAFAALACLFGYKWLARDETNRSYSCGTGTHGGTCFEGETINSVLTFVFATLAVTGIVLCVRAARSYRSSDPLESSTHHAVVVRLQQLEALRAAGVISPAEYARQREQVVDTDGRF